MIMINFGMALTFAWSSVGREGRAQSRLAIVAIVGSARRRSDNRPGMSWTLRCFDDGATLGAAAAEHALAAVRSIQQTTGNARIVAATGAAQFHFLEALTRGSGVDWNRVEMFHLDEYVGIPADHPASFRRFLQERLIRPTGMTRVHLLDGDADPDAVCARVGRELQAAPIDIAFVGIGENGHLAFNDPPADFLTERPYIVVTLDEVCRRQQVGEGWFASIEDVPRRAISMSVRQILDAREILCIVPEARKAEALRASLTSPVSPSVPASILRTHPRVTFYMDRESSALLPPELVRSR
jgi:glucosamine-6-phosphate deaminase